MSYMWTNTGWAHLVPDRRVGYKDVPSVDTCENEIWWQKIKIKKQSKLGKQTMGVYQQP
jgi:hypothetical protein